MSGIEGRGETNHGGESPASCSAAGYFLAGASSPQQRVLSAGSGSDLEGGHAAEFTGSMQQADNMQQTDNSDEDIESDLEETMESGEILSGPRGYYMQETGRRKIYASEESRKSHNKKEQKRRSELKYAVEELRRQLRKPTKKSSTICVLQAAQEEIKNLSTVKIREESSLEELRQKHGHLMLMRERLMQDLKKAPATSTIPFPPPPSVPHLPLPGSRLPYSSYSSIMGMSPSAGRTAPQSLIIMGPAAGVPPHPFMPPPPALVSISCSYPSHTQVPPLIAPLGRCPEGASTASHGPPPPPALSSDPPRAVPKPAYIFPPRLPISIFHPPPMGVPPRLHPPPLGMPGVGSSLSSAAIFPGISSWTTNPANEKPYFPVTVFSRPSMCTLSSTTTTPPCPLLSSSSFVPPCPPSSASLFVPPCSPSSSCSSLFLRPRPLFSSSSLHPLLSSSFTSSSDGHTIVVAPPYAGGTERLSRVSSGGGASEDADDSYSSSDISVGYPASPVQSDTESQDESRPQREEKTAPINDDEAIEESLREKRNTESHDGRRTHGRGKKTAPINDDEATEEGLDYGREKKARRGGFCSSSDSDSGGSCSSYDQGVRRRRTRSRTARRNGVKVAASSRRTTSRGGGRKARNKQTKTSNADGRKDMLDKSAATNGVCAVRSLVKATSILGTLSEEDAPAGGYGHGKGGTPLSEDSDETITGDNTAGGLVNLTSNYHFSTGVQRSKPQLHCGANGLLLPTCPPPLDSMPLTGAHDTPAGSLPHKPLEALLSQAGINMDKIIERFVSNFDSALSAAV